MTHEHPAHSAHHIVQGFGADRAAHYDTQASVNLAGVQAMYELGASALTAQLDGQVNVSAYGASAETDGSAGQGAERGHGQTPIAAAELRAEQAAKARADQS